MGAACRGSAWPKESGLGEAATRQVIMGLGSDSPHRAAVGGNTSSAPAPLEQASIGVRARQPHNASDLEAPSAPVRHAVCQLVGAPHGQAPWGFEFDNALTAQFGNGATDCFNGNPD